MGNINKWLKTFGILFISTLVLSCSKDDGIPDLDVNFVILISPEGGGTVSTNVSKNDDGVYTIRLTATPSAGYTFSHWLGSDCSSPNNTENPCNVYVFSFAVQSKTVKATAVFKEIE